MAQTTGVDPTDETYAVFVNSNQSNYISTQKSRVCIPFQANLADHEPNKGVQISLTSMLFTNTIYNITDNNNKMNILVYYAAGRGFNASFREIPVEIPPGFYNITQISNYLSKKDIMGRERVQQRFLYPNNIESYCNIFEGFGAVPVDPNDPIITKAAATNESNTKLIFQSPDLGHLIQFGTDINTAVLNPEDFKINGVYHSFLLQGLYVECPANAEILLKGLLILLGYYNIETAPALDIDLSANFGPARQGYGMEFIPKQAKSSGPAFDNTVYFQIANVENIPQSIILQTPTQFHGIVYTNNSVVLTCAYELNANAKVIELPNGFFVQGTSITVPSPYITGYQDAKAASADFIFGSNIVDLTGPITGTFVVGMAIGIQYNAVTLQPVDANDAALFDYAQGVTVPGQENDRCYYITAINSSTQVVLNQTWASASATINDILGTLYVLTSVQISTAGGLTVSMLASPQSVGDIAGFIAPNDVTNMAGVDEIHVHCTQLRTKNLSSTNFQPLAPSDVIAVVPVEVEFGFKQSYQPPNPIVTMLGNTNVQQLDIELTDAKGQLLDFHGVDWSMTFLVAEIDEQNAVNLNNVGNYNTPFQDQLAAMEGTAPLEQKRKMQRQLIFHDAGKRQNVGGHRPHYY